MKKVRLSRAERRTLLHSSQQSRVILADTDLGGTRRVPDVAREASDLGLARRRVWFAAPSEVWPLLRSLSLRMRQTEVADLRIRSLTPVQAKDAYYECLAHLYGSLLVKSDIDRRRVFESGRRYIRRTGDVLGVEGFVLTAAATPDQREWAEPLWVRFHAQTVAQYQAFPLYMCSLDGGILRQVEVGADAPSVIYAAPPGGQANHPGARENDERPAPDTKREAPPQPRVSVWPEDSGGITEAGSDSAKLQQFAGYTIDSMASLSGIAAGLIKIAKFAVGVSQGRNQFDDRGDPPPTVDLVAFDELLYSAEKMLRILASLETTQGVLRVVVLVAGKIVEAADWAARLESALRNKAIKKMSEAAAALREILEEVAGMIQSFGGMVVDGFTAAAAAFGRFADALISRVRDGVSWGAEAWLGVWDAGGRAVGSAFAGLDRFLVSMLGPALGAIDAFFIRGFCQVSHALGEAWAFVGAFAHDVNKRINDAITAGVETVDDALADVDEFFQAAYDKAVDVVLDAVGDVVEGIATVVVAVIQSIPPDPNRPNPMDDDDSGGGDPLVSTMDLPRDVGSVFLPNGEGEVVCGSVPRLGPGGLYVSELGFLSAFPAMLKYLVRLPVRGGDPSETDEDDSVAGMVDEYRLPGALIIDPPRARPQALQTALRRVHIG